MSILANFGALNKRPIALGALWSDDFNRASLGSDYTEEGTATFAIVANQLEVSGGSNSLDDYIIRNDYLTNLSFWNMPVKFVVGAISGTSYGHGIGIQSARTAVPYSNFSYAAIVKLDTGNVGKIEWYFKNDTTPVQTLATTRDIQAGDVLTLTFTRDQTDMTLEVHNSRTSLVYSDTFSTVVDLSGDPVPPNAGYFAIYTMGGSATFTEAAAYSDTPVGATYLLKADSIGYGAGASVLANAWLNLAVATLGGTFVNNAGFGNLVENNNGDEDVALSSGITIIMLGTNNGGLSESAATIFGKLQTYATALEGAGKVVGTSLLIGLIAPAFGETGVELNKLLLDEYGYDGTINFFKTLLEFNGLKIDAALQVGDDIHPNDPGYARMSDVFILKITNTDTIHHLSNFMDVNTTLLSAYVPDIGGGWVDYEGGTTSIINASARSSSIGGAGYSLCATTGIAVDDCVIRITMTASGNNGPFFICRFLDEDNFLYAYIDSGSPGSNSFYQVIGGVFTAIGSLSTSLTMLTTQDYEIKYVITGGGTNLEMFVDGVSKGSCTIHASLTGKQVGFLSSATTGSGRCKVVDVRNV